MRAGSLGGVEGETCGRAGHVGVRGVRPAQVVGPVRQPFPLPGYLDIDARQGRRSGKPGFQWQLQSPGQSRSCRGHHDHRPVFYQGGPKGQFLGRSKRHQSGQRRGKRDTRQVFREHI